MQSALAENFRYIEHIRKGIKQNFKFLRLVNPFFSCKNEEEFTEYKAQLHKLLDETITARLALFTRSRPKKTVSF